MVAWSTGDRSSGGFDQTGKYKVSWRKVGQSLELGSKGENISERVKEIRKRWDLTLSTNALNHQELPGLRSFQVWKGFLL